MSVIVSAYSRSLSHGLSTLSNPQSEFDVSVAAQLSAWDCFANRLTSRNERSALTLPSVHYDLTTLPNGLRVITESMPSLRSVALGCWVDTGTRDENDNEAGVSHFLEHLLFKGSEKLSAREVNETMDAIGGGVERLHLQRDHLLLGPSSRSGPACGARCPRRDNPAAGISTA